MHWPHLGLHDVLLDGFVAETPVTGKSDQITVGTYPDRGNLREIQVGGPELVRHVVKAEDVLGGCMNSGKSFQGVAVPDASATFDRLGL